MSLALTFHISHNKRPDREHLELELNGEVIKVYFEKPNVQSGTGVIVRVIASKEVKISRKKEIKNNVHDV